MFIFSNFSERLAEQMAEHGYNQTTLARALHTSRPKLALYMGGKHAPSYENFTALVQLFCCSADYLLGLTTQSPAACYRPVMPFSQRLNELLRASNTSLYALQKHTQLSWSVISRWRSGASNPSLYNLVKVAEYFDVTVDELLGRVS